MTKKDYIKIAKMFNTAYKGVNGIEAKFKPDYPTLFATELLIDKMVRDMIEVCAADNPNFNATRFIDACQKDAS